MTNNYNLRYKIAAYFLKISVQEVKLSLPVNDMQHVPFSHRQIFVFQPFLYHHRERERIQSKVAAVHGKEKYLSSLPPATQLTSRLVTRHKFYCLLNQLFQMMKVEQNNNIYDVTHPSRMSEISAQTTESVVFELMINNFRGFVQINNKGVEK